MPDPRGARPHALPAWIELAGMVLASSLIGVAGVTLAVFVGSLI